MKLINSGIVRFSTGSCCRSLVREGLELALVRGAVDDELVLGRLLDDAGGDELAHQVAGHLVGLLVLLELLELLLHLVELRQLGRRLGLLLLLRQLLGLDLLEGPPPLARDLENNPN